MELLPLLLEEWRWAMPILVGFTPIPTRATTNPLWRMELPLPPTLSSPLEPILLSLSNPHNKHTLRNDPTHRSELR